MAGHDPLPKLAAPTARPRRRHGSMAGLIRLLIRQSRMSEGKTSLLTVEQELLLMELANQTNLLQQLARKAEEAGFLAVIIQLTSLQQRLSTLIDTYYRIHHSIHLFCFLVPIIAKVNLGRSFSGLVRYLFEGHHNDPTANKQAEVLAGNGVRLGSMPQMITDFNRHRLINPDLGVAVWHAALSFHANDRTRLTNSMFIRLAEEYMEALGMNARRTQWLLVKHNDTAHPHAHLVMSRVDFDGLTIDRSFSKARRSPGG